MMIAQKIAHCGRAFSAFPTKFSIALCFMVVKTEDCIVWT